MKIICPVCGNDDTGDYWGRVWRADTKKVCTCRACRSFFIWPPNSQEEQALFNKEYASYIAERDKIISPHVSETFSEMVDESIAERMADIGHRFPQGASVLEIGAEKGGFLDCLKIKNGRRRLVGVDTCPEYKDILLGKGHEAYLYIDDVPKDSKFDRICFFSLLEHVRAPQQFLADISKLLNPNGMVVIEVPSAREPLLSLYDVDAFKDFYFQAMHLQVFSPEAIEKLMLRAGFHAVEIQYKQRYGLDNHVHWIRRGKPGGSPELARVFGPTANKAYIQALEASGNTDTIYVVAKIK